MNKNLKKVLLPFIIILILNLSSFYLSVNYALTVGYYPDFGIPIVAGILFGPYGVIGAVLGNLTGDLISIGGIDIEIMGYVIYMNTIMFGVSYLAYKLWYVSFKSRKTATPPKFINTSKILLFMGILFICSLIFGLLAKKTTILFIPDLTDIIYEVGMMYFFNIFNITFIFGVLGIWLSKYLDFVHIPKKSERKENNKLYNAIFILMIVITIIFAITDLYLQKSDLMIQIEIIIILALTFIYLTRPMTMEIINIDYDTISKKIMDIFLLTTMIVIIIGYLLGQHSALIDIINTGLDEISPIDITIKNITILIIADIALLSFFIPTMGVLRYIETKFITPIISFSQIERYIKKGDRIETEGLIDVYSEYINENNEIGMMARSYTDLISYTNEYVDNIHKIEGEKQRIEAELNIAERIQKSNLPTEAIENEIYSVSGYSRPAKEVGGDFYDYYEIDEDNVAIVIGDASGKGVPAALLSTITQAIIKQILKNEKDPSQVLYHLNNQLCEHNTEFMFITLWLGIYNTKTDILTFSNAGHDTPFINKDGVFEEIKMDKGIVLGIMEDFEFVKEETPMHNGIILYTDGITDAKNSDDEFYSEKRLMDFLNNNKFDKDIMEKLINDLDEFIKGAEQFDDMTLVFFEKHD